MNQRSGAKCLNIWAEYISVQLDNSSRNAKKNRCVTTLTSIPADSHVVHTLHSYRGECSPSEFDLLILRPSRVFVLKAWPAEDTIIMTISTRLSWLAILALENLPFYLVSRETNSTLSRNQPSVLNLPHEVFK